MLVAPLFTSEPIRRMLVADPPFGVKVMLDSVCVERGIKPTSNSRLLPAPIVCEWLPDETLPKCVALPESNDKAISGYGCTPS